MGESWLKSTALMLAGIAVGVGLVGPIAQAAENWPKVTPSAQTFYVDGRKVDLEAYEIGGHNYVKLRDIGKAVGFEVDYDAAANSVTIGGKAVGADYAAQADPAIFTGTLTKEVYNGIRDSIVHREEILAGSYEPIPLAGVANTDNLAGFSGTIGLWPSYQFKRNDAGDIVCRPRYTPAWQAAADHCQPFIDSLAGLPDREKVRQMDFYVCDRMTYALQNASIGSILSQDGVVPSYCANYA